MESKTDFAKFIRESAWISFGSVIALVGSFIFWVIAGVLSNSTQVGYATTAFSVASLSWGVLNLGLDTAALREVALSRRKAYSALVVISIILGLFAAGITFIFASTYQNFEPFVILASVMAVVGPISLVSTASLIGIQNARLYFVAYATGLFSRICLLIPFLSLGLGGLGITLAFATSVVITAVFSIVAMVRKVGIQKPERGALQSALGIGISNYPAALTTLFVSGGTVFLSLLTKNPAQVGSFYIAIMISVAAGAIGNGVSSAILPALSKENSKKIKDEALRLGLALTLPLALPLLIYPKNVLSLLGPSYILGTNPLFILSWSVLPYAALSIVLKRANAERLLRRVAIATLTQLLLLIGLMVLLTPSMGTTGASYAYLASIVAGLLTLAKRSELTNVAKIFLIFVMIYLVSILFAMIQLEWIAGLIVLEGVTVAALLTIRSLKFSDARLIPLKKSSA